jgi:hypothetical protein
MTHLLTWHGTVVCREHARGALVHRPLTGPFGGVDVLDIGDLSKGLQADIGHLMRDDDDALHVVLDRGPLAGWTISRAPDHRSLIVSRGGNSLTAQAGGDRIALAAGNPGYEGRFLAVGPEDLAALRDVVTARWLVESTGASMQPQAGALTAGFGLLIGTLHVDLCWNLPFDLSEWPHQLTLLPEAWRLDRIYRYRPLVYFTAFGDATIMRQFALSLASLVTTGAYDGAIVVMTDKTTAEIGALVPPGMRATLVVLPTVARDRLGYLASRLTIGRWPDAWAFQPLLYVDTDIIFDLPVSGMLKAIALSDRMTAVVEPTEPLGTSDVVGSGLLLADGCLPGAELGFNFGALGIPNLRRHGSMLALMGRVLHNRLTMCGRESLPFPDQAIANYVAYRRNAVDTALLSAYIRLVNHRADPAGRRGLVHFCWATGAVNKAEAMQRYVRLLAEPDGAVGTLASSP